MERKAVLEAKRPQDPQEPYPYHSENVKFKNKKAGITLAGTLTFPKEGKDFPVAVLISGSGPQNRNEEVLRFNHRPFLVLSDEAIAVNELLIDKVTAWIGEITK